MSQTAEWVTLGLGLAVLLAGAAYVALRARQSGETAFASDHARIVQEAGGAMPPPTEVPRPTRRFPVRPLGQVDRSRYADAWRAIQIEQMDEPGRACAHADLLIAEVLTARGYPPGAADLPAEGLAAEQAAVLGHFRAAHEVAARHETATPVELRGAMAEFQVLVDELVGEASLPDRVRPGRVR
jgi:hypothetical protein